ncbi:MAG: flagellar export protein FliJ [bacterium]
MIGLAKFVFQLEAVIEQRKGIERQRQLALGRVQAQRLAVEAKVEAVRRRLDERRLDLRDRLAPGRGVEIGAVRMQSASALFGLVELRRLAVELSGVLKRVEAARAELLRATVARKAVEHLRAKALAEWLREQARREGAELDDLVLMRRAALASGAGIGGIDDQEYAA